MDNYSELLNHLAGLWASFSLWLFPSVWVFLGIFAFIKERRLAGFFLLLAGLSIILFLFLFSPYSSFTDGWDTDAPLSVYFNYKPWGFLAANLLPAIGNLSLVAALVFLIKHRGK
jgi:hypothetical protein